MKKNLLFAGILLAALPVCAQDVPTWHPETDPYVMFTQDFEFDGASFAEWQAKVIGRIDSVQYYIHEKESGDNLGQNAKPWTDRENWKKGPWRDTAIILRNDVMVADNAKDSNAMRFDKWDIIEDYGSDAGDKRREQMQQYNRTGGKKYFKYVSTDTAGALSNSSAWSGNLAARYRRNLFVRGIDIKPYSSYRLTAYVTAHKDGKKQLAADSVSLQYKPTMYFDVMRGHFASEKPFTMGIENDAAHYKYNKKIEKDVVFESANAKRATYKEDQWSKVTFMTYYINDSIANDYVFVDGYWWDAEWSWTSEETGNQEWNYIVQPDKFFVRVGFASDSTTFGIDDISLTKSWIGGCEFTGNILRVDFGYETNIKDLCADAQTETGIAAIELDPQYFSLFGHYTDGEDEGWEAVDVTSAEYHKDGYMYIFQDRSADYALGTYDSVVVSFTNPTDPKLRLCYNKNSVFPKAWDTVWIKDGCPVEDFTNEVATKNPNIADGVYSMYDLPPVFKGGVTYETGSFQLPGNTTELTFKFSKRIAYDNAPNTVSAVMLVNKAGVKDAEYWTISNITDDTLVTFQRPAEEGREFDAVLSGDYQFSIVQVYGADVSEPAFQLTERGEDAVFAYSFGDASMPEGVTDYVDFLPYNYDRQFTKGVNISGFSTSHCATRVAQFSGAYTRGLLWGVWGQEVGAEQNESNRPKLQYKVEIPADGVYDFQFGMTMGDGYSVSSLYVYLFDEAGKKDSLTGYKVLSGTTNTKAVEYKEKPGKNVIMTADPNDVTEIENGINEYKFFTSNLKAGTYTISFEQNAPQSSFSMSSFSWKTTTNGMILYYLEVVPQSNEIQTGFGIAYGPMSTFSKAVAALAKTIAKAAADEAKYTGTTYSASVGVKDGYADFNGTVKVTAPSAWNAASAEISAADKALAARMALVDEMYAQRKMLTDTLAAFAAKDHEGMNTYIASAADLAKYESLVPSGATDDTIKAITELYKKDADLMAKHAAAIDAFKAAMTVADDSIMSETADKTYDEYAALQTAYGIASAVEYNNEPADTIAKRKDALILATSNYAYAFLADEFNRAYIADLAALPGLDLSASASDIATMLENREYAKLEAIYRNSIKARLYSEIIAGTVSDSLPLNALIKNNKLYATALIRERMDIKIPESANQIKSAADGCNIVHTRHQHNDSGNQPIWIMVLDNDFTNLFPAWTVRSVFQNNNGNQMASPDREGYANFKAGKTFFDGNLSIDWNSKAELSTRVEDLPAGIFEVGADFASSSESKLVVNKTEKKVNNTAFVSVAGVQDTADIKVTLVSGNGWSTLDNFTLTFRAADPKADYATLLDAATGAITSVLTFDDAADEAEAQYEYYTLDGIKTDAPEGIVLRKNIATGEVEKVLIK